MPLPSVAASVITCGLSKGGYLKEITMRSILLYFIGVPIPIILLIALFTHHF